MTRRVYDLGERLIEFGVRVCRMAEGLPRSRIGTHIADQLIRSGVSPASNYGEAQSAESRKDFIHKLKVCLKELRETMVWLKYAQRLGLADHTTLQSIVRETDQLIAIFVASIATARANEGPKRSM